MDKQAQDRLWNKLTPEVKKEIQNKYKKAESEKDNFFALEYQILMRDKYGTHNLNHQPLTYSTMR